MNKLTKEWVEKAEEDFSVAEKLAQEGSRFDDSVCFHCQQATEKYLKAWIQELGLPLQRTHELEDLLDVLRPHAASLRVSRKRMAEMTKCAVAYRYPRMHAAPGEAQSALRLARRVRRKIREKLGLDKPPKKRKKRA